jgi:DNA-binding winged helix-turn-helix (wHTH) protein
VVELGRFGILADGRPIRLGGRAFDVLMALIEASRDELLSRVQEGRIAELRKGFSADHKLIPMVADRVTGSPARSPRSLG